MVVLEVLDLELISDLAMALSRDMSLVSLRIRHDAFTEPTVPYLHFVKFQPINQLVGLLSLKEDGLLVVLELQVLDVIY